MAALDATYYADAALRAFKRRQQLEQLDQEGSYDQTDTKTALRRLAEARVPALQQTRETANKQGLFYSGQLGKRLGQVETDFAQREGDTQRDFDRRQATRDAARRAIESGAPLEEAAASAAATDRQITHDTELADSNALALQQAQAAPRAGGAPAKGAPRAPAKGTVRPAAPAAPVQTGVHQTSQALAIARANRRPRIR